VVLYVSYGVTKKKKKTLLDYIIIYRYEIFCHHFDRETKMFYGVEKIFLSYYYLKGHNILL